MILMSKSSDSIHKPIVTKKHSSLFKFMTFGLIGLVFEYCIVLVKIFELSFTATATTKSSV